MAATDARPFPIRNTAYRVTFPIFDADGDLVTGAASLDTELSGDGGTFADATNEATEIAASSGMYYLDLTAGEMNYDTVAIIVKTSTSGAKTTPIVLYPVEATDIHVNVKSISDDTTSADNLESYTDGTTPAPVNMIQISGDATAADNAEANFDGTGYAGTNNVIPTVTTVVNLTNERGKYANGAVWIGPTANTNTTSYVDGIITNPVSTIAAAKTIADALRMRRFEVIRTGTVQIAATLAGYRLSGLGWTCTTTGGSQDVGTTAFVGANVASGTYASTTGTINWDSCEFSTGVSVGISNMVNCRFQGTLTLSTAGNYDFIDCTSVVAGTGTPVFAIPSGTVNVSFRRWSGGISITGITSGTTISIDMVSGGTVTLAGADGNVQVRGMTAGITDNRTGTPTLGQNAAINMPKINAECDTALTDYDPPTNAEMEARTLVAANYFDPAADTVTNVTTVGAVTGDIGGDLLGSVAGNVDGNVQAVTDPVTVGTINTDVINAASLAADAIDEILDEVIEGTITFRQALRIFLAVLAGISTGGGTATITFRDVADAKARVTATVDANRNRTAITLDGA